MKTIKKVYLSGLGAIGSAYASKLLELDPECIKVVADRARIERYTQSGIIVNDKLCSFSYIAPEEDAAPADLIMIAVKQHHLEQSINDITKFVGEDTIILPLLNGIVSEEVVGRVYGSDKILHSFVVGTDAVREGTKVIYSKIGKIVFGDKEGSAASQKVAAVKELFDRANVPYSIPEDIIREQWWKFLMNVGLNQTSAILKAPYGVFQSVKECCDIMVMASREVVAIAQKAGINLTEEDITQYMKILDTLSPAGKTSMLQDVEAGRKTEVEIFAGTVMELGRKYAVDTSVNDILFKMIRTLEQTYHVNKS